jgi:hypothetical protein
MNKQGHEGIKYVRHPIRGRLGESAKISFDPTDEPIAIGARPDPETSFKEPFKLTLRPWHDDPPVTLLTLHPDGSVETGAPVDASLLWVAMHGENPTIAIVAACLSEVARLRREVDSLKKMTKRNRRKP